MASEAQKDKQSNGPTVLIQKKKQKVPKEDDKNCQSIKNVKPKHDDLDSQSTVIMCSDKDCQENESIDMQPVKPKKDVWSKKPAMKSSHKKLIVLNKNCKATTCENADFKSQSFKCSDKNCQENINMQSVPVSLRGGWSNFSCGLIMPNARLVAHEIKILPSWLATKKMVLLYTSCIWMYNI